MQTQSAPSTGRPLMQTRSASRDLATPERAEAFFKKYEGVDIEKNRYYSRIKIMVDARLATYDADARITKGVRRLVDFEDAEKRTMNRHLMALVQEAQHDVGLPLTTPVIGLSGNIVIAPKCGRVSNGWRKGNIHRDFNSPEVSGVYTFMLFLDDVTADNGAIEIWKESEECQVNPKNSMRAIDQDNLISECVEGKAGSLYIWDARLLHRSLPNKTETDRVTIAWVVKEENGPIIEEST